MDEPSKPRLVESIHGLLSFKPGIRAKLSWPAEVIEHVSGTELHFIALRIVRPGCHLSGPEPDSNVCVSLDLLPARKRRASSSAINGTWTASR